MKKQRRIAFCFVWTDWSILILFKNLLAIWPYLISELVGIQRNKNWSHSSGIFSSFFTVKFSFLISSLFHLNFFIVPSDVTVIAMYLYLTINHKRSECTWKKVKLIYGKWWLQNAMFPYVFYSVYIFIRYCCICKNHQFVFNIFHLYSIHLHLYLIIFIIYSIRSICIVYFTLQSFTCRMYYTSLSFYFSEIPF